MAYFVVEKMAQVVNVTKHTLEADLRNAEPLYSNQSGARSCVSGGEAFIWCAGRTGEYAIKAYRQGLENHAAREFESIMALQRESGHVPKVYCLGTLVDDEGGRWRAIVEEFVRGSSLARIVEEGLLTGNVRGGGLSSCQTVLIALELARGINELGRSNTAHRDISNNNVLLGQRCIEDQLRHGVDLFIIDFGSSTCTQRSDVTPVNAGLRLATIPFGAPEIYGGDHTAFRAFADGSSSFGRNSPSTDVWSLGAIIAYLECGEAYWPPSIEDIRVNGFGWTRRPLDELKRIAKAKEDPIDLLQLIRRTREPDRLDVELAEIVRLCTFYEPNRRIGIGMLTGELNRLAESASWDVPAVTPPSR